jgi:hypothetical protein
MNLTQLRATIRAYSENDFPQTVGSGGLTSDEQVDTFIEQAEQRIFNSVQFPNFRKNQTGTLTADNKYLEDASRFSGFVFFGGHYGRKLRVFTK